MATVRAAPRPTLAERAEERNVVEVDDALEILAAALEDWTAPRQSRVLELREGHESGRANNVEARLLYVSGEQLVLRFEERDGIAKLARLEPNGLHVELFHILTTT